MSAALQDPASFALDPASVLNALSASVMVIDGEGALVSLNLAAETLLGVSAGTAVGEPLLNWFAEDSPIVAMVTHSRRNLVSVSDYDLRFESARIGPKICNVQVAPVPEMPGHVVLSLQERSIASKLEHEMSYQGAVHSVTSMAAMLAHEVKNPLSGIRGAAQLLEQSVEESDAPLTQLICDETDRICALVDRMEVFSDDRPIDRAAVNIHEVLEHCRRIAQNGFGKHVRFVENYDPSLPAVLGNRDQLVQVFLNLIKNASEAVPDVNGEIVLKTNYRHGMRVAVLGTQQRRHLPLQVSIQDNGPGIPDELRAHLFDPFVTSKVNGTGLGLALVAKSIADHGGVIELDSIAGKTVFRLSLPIVEASADSEGLV